jgi:foldase protein PrsA
VNRKIKSKINTQQVKKQQKVVNPKIVIITSIIIVIVLIGGMLFDQLYERTVLTVDDEKYQMSDLSYYFYSLESQYDYYNQLFGGSYWDMTYDETTGATMRDAAKQEAIDSAIYTEILYKEAVSAGYTLTEEDKATVATNVTSLLEGQLTEAVIRKNDFTKNYLTDFLNKSAIVDRYRQDKIDAFDIDDEGIKADYALEDYRQYDVDLLYISTQSTDAEGNAVDVSAEEKTAALDRLKALNETAKTTESWSTLVPEGEEDLIYKTDNFIETDTKFDENFEAMIMGMENDSVSEVYEAEDGYYIVRMLNNNSTERYDSTVAQAITDEENSRFSTLYSEISAKHEYTINEGYLKSLTMGSITLAN